MKEINEQSMLKWVVKQGPYANTALNTVDGSCDDGEPVVGLVTVIRPMRPEWFARNVSVLPNGERRQRQ
jgi:hypothetical protein